MVTVIFTETFKSHKHSTQRIPERRNYTLNSNHRNLKTTITCNLCPFDLLCVAVFASHPAIVLFASSWVVAALVYGAFDLQVTTDPVEIWASPQSRSRLEKEYFDSRFEPFYRMEQVFVKAVGIQKVSMWVVQMKPVRRLFWAMDYISLQIVLMGAEVGKILIHKSTDLLRKKFLGLVLRLAHHRCLHVFIRPESTTLVSTFMKRPNTRRHFV
jgi:hypothetical protein